MPEKCTEPCAELVRLEHHLEELEAQNSSSHQGIYDRLRALETSDAVQDANYNTIIEKLDTVTAKLELLEGKPGKRWDSIVDKVIWAVVGALVVYALGRIGL